MSRIWIYASTDKERNKHLNERVSRPVIRCLDESFSYFGEECAVPHATLSYDLIPLPPQSTTDTENDMDYLPKKDSRSGIEPYPNYGVHVPNSALIRPYDDGYVLNLPSVEGTVIGYSPPMDERTSKGNDEEGFEFEPERQRESEALYRILWDGSSAGIGYIEDVTLHELLSLGTKKSEREMQALAVHKSVRATGIRKRLALKWKMESLLTKLVVLAGLELRREVGQKVRFELLLERKRLRDAAEGMENKGMGGGSRKNNAEINADGNEFGYYLKHPNQYMSSFQPPPPLPSDDEDEDDDDITKSSKPRSKTKLTKEELVKYNEKVNEQCNFAPSKLAERVKLACSLAFNYASRNGLLDKYIAESERRKERERVSREEMGVSNGVSTLRWGAAADGEVRRSSRARNTVNYAEDGVQHVESILDEHEGIVKSSGYVGISSDFPRKEVSGGPTAIYLLESLGFSKESNVADERAADGDGEDPFFEPDPCHVIDQLGRKQRYMSPANIQEAICHNIDGDHIETPPSLLDEEQIIETGELSYISDIICTSDDKLHDLPHFEPASFARCRFATRTFIPETDQEGAENVENDTKAQKKAKAEAMAIAKKLQDERKRARLAIEQKRNTKLENLYRSKKSFELWRFKSIHGNGCAVWPSWSDRSKSVLKDLFVTDSADTDQLVTEYVQNPQPITDLSAPMDQTQNDEALAQSLAAAENTRDGEVPAKRRRTTRRAAGGDEPVFYGSHQSMSRDQLLSTIVRILRQAKPKSLSIMKLKQLVFATNFEASRGEVVEWRKLRSALGHLVFRRGRVGRLLVDVAGDATCWNLLKEGALVKFDSPLVTAADPSGDTTLFSIAGTSHHLLTKLTALEHYVQNLHRTELSLRTALMKAIDKGGQSGESLLQISTVAIATAADEMEGEAEAEDWKYFNTDESKEEISWKSSDHCLIGEMIFRPPRSAILVEDKLEPGEKCHWYKIISFTPSVKEENNNNEDGTQSQDPNAVEPNPIVARRMRFRAISMTSRNINTKMDMEEEDTLEYMVLTEPQVRAGIEAAVLHRKICSRNPPQFEQSTKSPTLSHPFKNHTGAKVMLSPLTDNTGSNVLYGVIGGHDYSTEKECITNKVLILLENEGEPANSCAFWSTVNNDGTILTDVIGDPNHSLCPSYKIDMHEYFQGSEAYSACETILTYMKNHQRSGPFINPVDPVALQLPDYFTVIKHPMDISTLEKNLVEGTYSRVPPTPNADEVEEEENPVADHPVYKMVRGPFYDDAMKIFDNAILYNSIESWVGREADLMKKNVIRKIDQVISKATVSWYRQESGKGPQAKKSLYVEEDSDVDMYEYESDYDDEDGLKSKSKKGRTKKTPKQRVQDDIPSKAIEKPYMLPEKTIDFNVSRSFPHMKIQTNVSRFALPQDWSCRLVSSSPEDDGANESETTQKEKEAEEMLSLLQMQQEEDTHIRRSSRARVAPKTYTDDMMTEVTTTNDTISFQKPIVLPGAEYYLMNSDCFQPEMDPSDPTSEITSRLLPTSSESRIGVEGIRETLHEQFYAKMYRQHSPNAMVLENEVGKYVDGTFPPYLGRVFDTSSSTNGNEIVWEIREQYVMPALRWVLRGLVHSGHLAEVDGSLSEGLAAENDISMTGPRAGMTFSFGSGVVVPNHEYYFNEKFEPFDVLDEKEIMRKRRLQGCDDDESSEEEVELSAYEKLRAERMARNAERLKQLGFA